jgi:hypothetical protein
MSDPIGDRLRAYYLSIQGDEPPRLRVNAARVLDSGVPTRGPRFSWRPAAGLAAVGALVIVAALVLRGVGPNAATSTELPSATAPESAAPTPSTSVEPTPASIEPSESGTAISTSEPTPTVGPTPTAVPTPTVGPSPSPSPARVTLAPGQTVGKFGTPFVNPVGRMNYTVTPLKDGRVLIAGGVSFGDAPPAGRLGVAQLWDPGTGKFTTTGSLNEPRTDHTATLLGDGRVLITGGADLSDGIDNQASAELYDPATGKFTMTGAMSHGRAYHTATLLPDGKVLIAGGYGGGTLPTATAELYDPATGSFSPTGSMSVARDRHTATLLPDGKVLIAGGVDEENRALASAELYQPATGTFSPTEPMNVGRYGAAAVRFTDAAHPTTSYVLIAGGRGESGEALDTAEVYVPTQNGFGLTPHPMSAARGNPTAALVVTAHYVLVVGGDSSTADLFNPSTGNFTPLGPAGAGAGQTATLLSDCRILLSGSGGKSWELFTTVRCTA